MTSHKNGPTSSNVTRPHLLITGTRGIPAQHGGFETFAEELARYLTQQGWHVSVYCQIQPEQQQTFRPHWQGIKRIPIVVHGNRAHHTLIFDYKCLRDALTRPGLILTLGYGGAIFNLLANLKKRPYLINMDGLEWKRQKWPWYAKIWLKLNEQIAMQAATHLIADHPVIEDYLNKRVRKNKVTMIAYGAHSPKDAHTNRETLARFGLTPQQYTLLIARPEPENNVKTLIETYCQAPGTMPLIVLGDYNQTPYARQIQQNACHKVRFVGGIYDPDQVQALRQHAHAYFHGHSVGGTNPSLVESLACGNLILAHDNPFNRGVLKEAGLYFHDRPSCLKQIETILDPDQAERHRQLRKKNQKRFAHSYQWSNILQQYKTLLSAQLKRPGQIDTQHG